MSAPGHTAPIAKRRMAASQARPGVDLRRVLAAAIDQGPRPLCMPVTFTAAHEALRAQILSAAPEGLAPEPLWRHCVQTGAADATGTTVAAAAQALAGPGQPLLSEWPFRHDLGVRTEAQPATVGAPPWHIAVVAEHTLARDGMETAMENALAAGRPAVLVLEVTREFRNAPSNGEVALAPLNTPLGEGHAVLVVGAATHATRGRQLLVRNSWGPRWGAGGFGWLPLTWVAAFGFSWASVTP